MKLVIDCSILRNPGTGVEHYTCRLVESLRGLDPILIRPDRLDHPLFDGSRTHRLPRRPQFPGARTAFAVLAPPRMPAADVIHLPAPEAPFVRKPPARLVISVHDITPLLFPHWHTRWRVAYFRLVVRRLIRMADAVLASSRSTRRDLVSRLNIPKTRVHVVYPGVADRFRPCRRDRRLLEGYGIREPYLLTVGTVEPRKNIARLVEAYGRVRPDALLVVVGGKGWHSSSIFRTVSRAGLSGRVIFTGYVPDDHLPQIYSSARAFLYPSLYEGFGFPVLEAMRCGTPVVTADRSSTAEIAGGAALLVDPGSASAIGRAMRRILSDEDLRHELIQNGLRQAAGFTWARCAQQTAAVYAALTGVDDDPAGADSAKG